MSAVLSDLDACQELMHAVHFDSSVLDWNTILKSQSEDVCAVFHRERIVGLVSAVPYLGGSKTQSSEKNVFGWLGNVVVRSSYRGRGIAGLLLEHGISFLLKRHGCLTAFLDASEMGRPMYRRHGFQDCALVHRMKVVDAGAANRWASELTGGGLAPVPTDYGVLPEVLNIDRHCFGADRQPSSSLSLQSGSLTVRFSEAARSVFRVSGQVRLRGRGLFLERWMRQIPGSSFHLRHSSGDLRGYSFTHERGGCAYIGPVVADDAEAARALIGASLQRLLPPARSRRRRRDVVVLVIGRLPAAGEPVALGLDWASELARNGFALEETTTRQALPAEPQPCRGRILPGDPWRVVAAGSLDLG
mmetsp:Transcript_21525/g.51363  ORF Transcript_21525/g.51363 Transcript_21525/m.51363 type:complete len:360 (+) Transcript_21525:139-1218(+)